MKSRFDTERKETKPLHTAQAQAETISVVLKDILPVELYFVNKTALEATWDQLVG